MNDTADRKTDHTIGVLLLNLGGPDSLEAVRPFLYNLFSDREIIRLGPSFLQKPIARIISTFRSSKSRRMYGMIGGRSPILEITTAQAEALDKALNKEVMGVDSLQGEKTSASQQLSFLTSQPLYKVYIGMRYWHPYIKDTVKRMVQDGIKEVIVLSLYPHYSKTTTGSSVSAFKYAAEEMGLSIKYIEQWFDFPPYIDAMCELIHEGIQKFKDEDIVLLYSAHSLPKSFIDEGDPYLDHIKGTIEAANKRLSEEPYNIKDIKWQLSFQSRSGPVEWLEPSTDNTILKLGEKGCRNILVVPISFVSDHIETLYEVDILFRELAKGQGINLRRCGSLNTSEKFINALKELVMIKTSEAQ
ncbi:MAG: ferrochelatase [Thermodesulfovibrionia bacterium]|nr:ferrochelatase [Thermodesulfovibrionia bacterium]